ncbi:MAG: response regulator [Planctomycetes bacterium]|nr:response regulator [Planctomycetota bacterium]
MDTHASISTSASRILLVEDEPTIAVTLGDDLECSGFDVVRVGNGAEAIRLLQRERFAAVVTDVRLPGADGIAVLRAAKANAAPMPVLVVSANWATLAVAGVHGADGFLAKPFGNELVVEWLRARCCRRWSA